MKIGVIILARANFGRWPDKALYKLDGKTILEQTIIKAKKLDVEYVIVSTTDSIEDQVIRNIAWDQNVEICRGDPDNRTKRYCQAIMEYGLDYFIPLAITTPFFDVEYTNKVINAARENPGSDVYVCGGITNGFVQRVYRSEITLQNQNPDQEIFTDNIETVFRLHKWYESDLKNRYLFNGNIAYKIEADNHRRICEHLGHFPVDYDEVAKALMGIK